MDKAECHILCIFRYIAISIAGMLMLSMASCISSTNYKESLDPDIYRERGLPHGAQYM